MPTCDAGSDASQGAGKPRPRPAVLQPVQAALLCAFYGALEQSMACGEYGSLTRHRPPSAACTFFRHNRKVCP